MSSGPWGRRAVPGQAGRGPGPVSCGCWVSPPCGPAPHIWPREPPWDPGCVCTEASAYTLPRGQPAAEGQGLLWPPQLPVLRLGVGEQQGPRGPDPRPGLCLRPHLPLQVQVPTRIRQALMGPRPLASRGSPPPRAPPASWSSGQGSVTPWKHAEPGAPSPRQACNPGKDTPHTLDDTGSPRLRRMLRPRAGAPLPSPCQRGLSRALSPEHAPCASSQTLL